MQLHKQKKTTEGFGLFNYPNIFYPAINAVDAAKVELIDTLITNQQKFKTFKNNKKNLKNQTNFIFLKYEKKKYIYASQIFIYILLRSVQTSRRFVHCLSCRTPLQVKPSDQVVASNANV